MLGEVVVFWVGAAIFGCTSLLFAALEKRKLGKKAVFRSHIFVSFITAISYVVMALALGTTVSESGQSIYWTRWLFYIASCSILTLDIASIARKPAAKMVEVGVFTGLTMLCGFLASIIITGDRWWFFGLSTAAYIGMLYTLFKRSGDESVNVFSIRWFVLLT